VWLPINTESYANFEAVEKVAERCKTSQVFYFSVDNFLCNNRVGISVSVSLFFVVVIKMSILCVLWSQTRNDRSRKKRKHYFIIQFVLESTFSSISISGFFIFPKRSNFVFPTSVYLGNTLNLNVFWGEMISKIHNIQKGNTHLHLKSNFNYRKIRFLASSDPSRILSGRG
jgi:hypothetical protein